MSVEIEYWRHFLTRVRFPREGIFFLVPDDCGQRSYVLVSAEEPRRKLPVMLSGDDTPESCAAMFTAALAVPGLRRAEVLLPNTMMRHEDRASGPHTPEAMIYRYIPKAKRKAVSRRMLAAKKAKRLRLGVDAETLRYRTLHPHT